MGRQSFSKSVYSGECFPFFDENRSRLNLLENVFAYYGDSRKILTEILEKIGSHRTVFWLDSHWCCGQSAGEGDECPLLEELQILRERKNDIILIDDARYFLSVPPPPHEPKFWPTLADIIEVVTQFKYRRYVQILDDIIYLVPNEPEIKSKMIQISQKVAVRMQKERIRLKALQKKGAG